ncbi:hypothetical protein D3C76_1659220 [compost metagenome]
MLRFQFLDLEPGIQANAKAPRIEGLLMIVEGMVSVRHRHDQRASVFQQSIGMAYQKPGIGEVL